MINVFLELRYKVVRQKCVHACLLLVTHFMLYCLFAFHNDFSFLVFSSPGFPVSYFPVLHFHVLQFCAAFSISAFSSPAFFPVPQFPASHLQSPLRKMQANTFRMHASQAFVRCRRRGPCLGHPASLYPLPDLPSVTLQESKKTHLPSHNQSRRQHLPAG